MLTIAQDHGIQGFLRGLAPRLLRRALMAAISWTVYEQVNISIATIYDRVSWFLSTANRLFAVLQLKLQPIIIGFIYTLAAR